MSHVVQPLLLGSALLGCALSGCARSAPAPPQAPVSVLQQAEQYIAHLQSVEQDARQNAYHSGSQQLAAGGAFGPRKPTAEELPAEELPAEELRKASMAEAAQPSATHVAYQPVTSRRTTQADSRTPIQADSRTAVQADSRTAVQADSRTAVQAVEVAAVENATNEARDSDLRLADAQCRAARHAPVANALYRQSCEILRSGQERRRLREAANLAAALLQCQAITERNDAAADAYALFFQLAELQQQHGLLEELESLLLENERVLANLRESGIGAKGDPTEVERQQLELRQQQIDLEHGVEGFAQALNVRMGNHRLAPAPIVHTELGADRSFVDVDRAVADGIACRSDLGQLRVLNRCLNTSNAETAQQLLSLIEPALGAVLKAKCECFSCLRCLIHCDDCCDVQKLRKQIQQLYRGAEEAAEVEIASNAVQVNRTIHRLEVAEQIVLAWDRRVEQLRKVAKQDSSLYEQLAKARAERLKAIGDLIHDAAAVDLARGKLLASQGFLAQQCGVGQCCGSKCQTPTIADGDAEGVQWSTDQVNLDGIDWNEVLNVPIAPEANEPTGPTLAPLHRPSREAPATEARAVRSARRDRSATSEPQPSTEPITSPEPKGNREKIPPDTLEEPSGAPEKDAPIRLDAIGRFRPISVANP